MLTSRVVGLAATLLALGSLSACGGDSDSDPGTTTDSAPVTIAITEQGGKIEPSDGHVVQVDRGQDIDLVVTSDVDDEIHVHSDPEHEFEVTAGKEQTFSFSIDTPGSYEVESHGLEVTLVKLQVS